jgi:hypothetical protein
MCAASKSAQAPADFTGHWRQANSSAARQIEIEQKGQSLRVKTTATNSGGTRNAEEKFEIGGAATSYLGLDGDQFRSTVHWDGAALVFDTVEQEDGKEIPQKTVWTLSKDNNTLQIDREMTKSGKTTHSSNTYQRQP